MSFNITLDSIKTAFHNMDMYKKGAIRQIEYFSFTDAFKDLIQEFNCLNNYTNNNAEQIKICIKLAHYFVGEQEDYTVEGNAISMFKKEGNENFNNMVINLYHVIENWEHFGINYESLNSFDKKFSFNSIAECFNDAALPPQQAETKTDKLKAELGKYGFFELSKVKQLSEPNKQSLIELISTNDLPYSIAMFEYLVFLKHLKAEHFTTDYKLFKAVAKWFEVAERAVKGNIYVLNEHSKENRTRYTADQQKQTVQKDYEKLK